MESISQKRTTTKLLGTLNNKSPHFRRGSPNTPPWGYKKEIMINANELRIGNWLLFEGKPKQVESIDPLQEMQSRGLKCSIQIKQSFTDDLEHYSYTGRWLNRFEPIALSPKWLERIGTKCENQGWEYKIQVGALKWYFRWNTEWYSELGGIYLDSRIQCLHQIQNLYLDLTGNELPITQPLP
jgi:hypothetical protein